MLFFKRSRVRRLVHRVQRAGMVAVAAGLSLLPVPVVVGGVSGVAVQVAAFAQGIAGLARNLKQVLMDSSSNGGPARAGTAGGTLLVVLLQISSGELVKTAVLAAVGALVSFLVSYLLQRLLRKKGL